MVGQHPADKSVVVEVVKQPVEIADTSVQAIRGESEATTAKNEEITLKTAGQRKINLLWEFTQTYLAVMLVTPISIVGSLLAIRTGDVPDWLTILVGVVVGNYFARTNHAAIGGVGSKATDHQIYEGR